MERREGFGDVLDMRRPENVSKVRSHRLDMSPRNHVGAAGVERMSGVRGHGPSPSSSLELLLSAPPRRLPGRSACSPHRTPAPTERSLGVRS